MFYCTFFRVKKTASAAGRACPRGASPFRVQKKPPSRNGKGGKTWTGGGENKARKRRETSPRTERSFPEPGPPFLRQKTRPHTAPDGRKTARHVSARLPARGTARPCLRDTPRREAMPGADREAAALPGHAGRARLRKRAADLRLRLLLADWCPGGDSNSHAIRRYHLKIVCLPIPPPGHSCSSIKNAGLWQVFFHHFFHFSAEGASAPRKKRHETPPGTSCQAQIPGQSAFRPRLPTGPAPSAAGAPARHPDKTKGRRKLCALLGTGHPATTVTVASFRTWRGWRRDRRPVP